MHIRNVALSLCVLAVSCSGSTEPATNTDPDSHDQLIPLAVGNSWTYRSVGPNSWEDLGEELGGWSYPRILRVDSILRKRELPYRLQDASNPATGRATWYFDGHVWFAVGGTGLMCGRLPGLNQEADGEIGVFATIPNEPIDGQWTSDGGQWRDWPEPVETPAGTFTGCRMLHFSLGDRATRKLWIKPGVGLVRWETRHEDNLDLNNTWVLVQRVAQ